MDPGIIKGHGRKVLKKNKPEQDHSSNKDEIRFVTHHGFRNANELFGIFYSFLRVEQFQQESMIPAALQHPWDLNECISSPCLHGGTCVDGIVSYECVCTSDCRGDECGVCESCFAPFVCSISKEETARR